MTPLTPFWKHKSLAEMTCEEWESLCDGCGWCCMIKLEDEDTREVYYTHVACRLLDLKTCRCMEYENRNRLVPTCIHLTLETIESLTWLPETCAYRRVALGKDLPEWHHLICGSRKAVHQANASMLGRAISEYGVDADSLDEYIMLPEEGDPFRK